jgi:predicted RNA-binding Zn-ribbon protein involved in translation (DUF1610 family)
MDNSSDDLDEGDDSFSEVSEEEIRKLDEAIIAAEANEKTFFLVCPSCGSRDLGVIPRDVVAAASTIGTWEERYVCRSCGHEGAPLLFDDEEAYEKFCESKGAGTQGGVGA